MKGGLCKKLHLILVKWTPHAFDNTVIVYDIVFYEFLTLYNL